MPSIQCPWHPTLISKDNSPGRNRKNGVSLNQASHSHKCRTTSCLKTQAFRFGQTEYYHHQIVCGLHRCIWYLKKKEWTQHGDYRTFNRFGPDILRENCHFKNRPGRSTLEHALYQPKWKRSPPKPATDQRRTAQSILGMLNF